ncbi:MULTISPECIES: hypothetical protein [unclassified Anaeromyxobacter]|uniref:hypothetical protein n=1 Tax=unclassified Anaeromyxobacter TaxID=2620896 RepID=UPI001F5813E7|nr:MULTISPECIES: hypothetical protein [unclassified Anaeromyxobacter]
MRRLCQTERSSCGACCGLYNGRDLSREGLRAELSRRSRALARVPRTPAAFRAAAAAIAADSPAPLFPSVRICPLLGFLDAAETRVGCLAHPLATGGADLRDCGAYDVTTCDAFLCPSHAWLAEEEAALLDRALADDFHLYGLVVTDVPFLRAALAGVSARTGARVELRHLEHAPFRSALRRLFALKEELAPGSEGLFGAFRPGRDGEPVPRRIDYEALGAAPSPYDEILTCVGADPRSGNDLELFEREVTRRLDAAAAAFPRAVGR